MTIPIIRKVKREYQGLKVWAETHALIKALAEKYEVPMTNFLHSVAVNLAKVNGINIDDKGDVK